MDDAWRQTGVSFQDACEDAGINVEYSAVRNPEDKAQVERFFGTLNKLLFKKMPGGVPFDPVAMRKLDLDPRKTAAITRSRLEELIYQAIYEVYAKEVHSGIGMPPLLAWRKGMATTPREIIDDVDFLAAALGTVESGTLDRSGISFQNLAFHEPDITSRLLADLAGTTTARGARKRLSSAKARVKFKYNLGDASGIYVWNPNLKPRAGYVFLPNREAGYTAGLGFWHHKQIRKYAEAEGLAFSTEDEKRAARAKLRAAIEREAPGLKYAGMRKKRRLLDPPKPVLGRDTVEFDVMRAMYDEDQEFTAMASVFFEDFEAELAAM